MSLLILIIHRFTDHGAKFSLSGGILRLGTGTWGPKPPRLRERKTSEVAEYLKLETSEVVN